MTTIRSRREDPAAVVRLVKQLAFELGRIPTPDEVRRALAEAGVAARDVVDRVATSTEGISQHAFPSRSASAASPTAPLAEAVPPPADQPMVDAGGLGPPDSAPTAEGESDAWWIGILDLGAADAIAVGAVPDIVKLVVDDLADDWERSGKRLDEEHVARVMERRHLDAGQRAAVVRQLLERDIVPSVNDAELPYVKCTALPLEASSDHLGAYMRAVGRRRLLAPEEEVRLGRLVRRGQLAEEELASESRTRTRRITRQLEAEAARGRDAHGRFVEANLRLVISLARKRMVATEGVEMLDLIQFGNLGVMRAVDRFDPELGYKFSTYATWWIRQYMDRGVADTGRLVRLPVHVVEKLNRVRAATRQLGYSGHVVTSDVVAALTSLDRATVEYLWALDRPVVHLDAPIGAESDATVADILTVRHVDPGPESLACASEAHERVRIMLNQHCPDERSVRILSMRFGLDTDVPMTLDQIGQQLGVTRERIRQLEKKALARVREALSAQEFRDLIEALS